MILDAEGYKDSSLNSAYRSVKNEDIAADILTYVKNVLKGSPIVDKEEKIEDVMRRIKKLNKWNRAQQDILEKIAQSLRNDKYRSEEHTSELQSRQYLVCRLLLEKKKKKIL